MMVALQLIGKNYLGFFFYKSPRKKTAQAHGKFYKTLLRKNCIRYIVLSFIIFTINIDNVIKIETKFFILTNFEKFS